MAKYALVGPGGVIHTEKHESRVDLSAGTRDGYEWRIIEDVTDDQSTGANAVAEPVVETVEANRVLRTTVIRNMTAQEVDDSASAAAERFLEVSAGTKALGKVLAEVIRRVSNGSVPANLTEAQARQFVRNNFVQFYKE